MKGHVHHSIRCSIRWLAAAALAGTVCAAEDPIGYSTVASVREALRKDPKSASTTQHGWTVVASREKGAAIEWFFTPEGHAVYPAVVKRKVVEHDGVGEIELAALCETGQEPCDQLLEDFRQTHKVTIEAPHVERVTLDVGIAKNEHDRVRVNRMIAENGEVLYVGKAKSLKKRVSSYFQPGRHRALRSQPKIRTLIEMIADFDTIDVRSEPEALLLEVLDLARLERLELDTGLDPRLRARRVGRHEEAVVLERHPTAGSLRIGALRDLHPAAAPRAGLAHVSFDQHRLAGDVEPVYAPDRHAS